MCGIARLQVSSDEITTSAADTRVEDLQSELARTREAAAKDAKKAARMTKVVAELQKKVQNLTVSHENNGNPLLASLLKFGCSFRWMGYR